MSILVKNKHTLQIDEFKFKCCIGKNGSTRYKKEGDKKTPKGTFNIENLYFKKFVILFWKTSIITPTHIFFNFDTI